MCLPVDWASFAQGHPDPGGPVFSAERLPGRALGCTRLGLACRGSRKGLSSGPAAGVGPTFLPLSAPSAGPTALCGRLALAMALTSALGQTFSLGRRRG